KSANLGGFHVAALEQHEGRDAADAELGGSVLVFVDVQFYDLELAGILLGNFVENGGDHLARTTPLGPVVHQYRRLRLQHFGLEIAVSHVMNMLAHDSSHQGWLFWNGSGNRGLRRPDGAGPGVWPRGKFCETYANPGPASRKYGEWRSRRGPERGKNAPR